LNQQSRKLKSGAIGAIRPYGNRDSDVIEIAAKEFRGSQISEK